MRTAQLDRPVSKPIPARFRLFILNVHVTTGSVSGLLGSSYFLSHLDQAAPDSDDKGVVVEIAVEIAVSHLSIAFLNTATIVGAPTGLIPVICPPSKSTISMPPFTRPDQPISGSGPY